MARGFVTHTTRRRDGTFLIHYKSSMQFEPVDVTRFPWFQKLKATQGTFAFGLNAIGDSISVNKLESCVARQEKLDLGATREIPIKPQSNSIEGSVRRLIPVENSNEVLETLAASIRRANDLDPTKWGIRINKHTIMLKVGFVETLQIGRGNYYLLVEKKHVPAKLRNNRKLQFYEDEYKNAEGCGHCKFLLAETAQHFTSLWPAHAAALRVASQSPRHTTTAKDHSRDLIDFLSSVIGQPLSQPSYLQGNAFTDNRLFIEGMAIETIATRYERDPEARRRCISHYGARCVACGLNMADRYGPGVAGLIHVHHLAPLANSGQQLVDPVADSRPVCPNCHAVIHAQGAIRTIEQVRELIALYGQRNNIDSTE